MRVLFRIKVKYETSLLRPQAWHPQLGRPCVSEKASETPWDNESMSQMREPSGGRGMQKAGH